MNGLYIHLLLNHFPIIGIFIGSITLIIGLTLNSSVTKKVSLWIILLSSLIGIPTFLSGENAEEIIENLSTYNKNKHQLIHLHEEKAENFIVIVWFQIFFAIISLFLEWKKNKLSKISMFSTLIISLISIFLLKKVGESGGKISHQELYQKSKLTIDKD